MTGSFCMTQLKCVCPVHLCACLYVRVRYNRFGCFSYSQVLFVFIFCFRYYAGDDTEKHPLFSSARMWGTDSLPSFPPFLLGVGQQADFSSRTARYRAVRGLFGVAFDFATRKRRCFRRISLFRREESGSMGSVNAYAYLTHRSLLQ